MPATVTIGVPPGGSAGVPELAHVLRGRAVRPADPAAFVETALVHGVGPLLVAAGAGRLLPAAQAARLRDEARRQVALTIAREEELRRVLAALHRSGLEALVVKGAHLAAAVYRESWQRTRDDTDLLVKAEDRARVTAVLSRIGYRPQAVQTGAAVLGQTLFDREGSAGTALDVHWRLSQPAAASAVFDAGELLARGVPIPALGPAARGPSRIDALAIACLHQAAHHPGLPLLIWSYDVHLLLSGFEPGEVDAFAALALARRISAVSAAAIARAAGLFDTPGADALVERLRSPAGPEPTAAYLKGSGRLEAIARDLRALGGWQPRLRLAAGHLFPPAAYMRTTWAPSSTAPVAWLYLRRLLRAFR